ncbi:protein kinase domain-containing protein [Nocardiopsis synnemataformans]|uniref:protein kinase domain-containing protein n=1 Tax=Nocardiopsis synnemataformans TaxID=61305 RepID=UPI003EBFB4B9
MNENSSPDGVYLTPLREEVPCRLARIRTEGPDPRTHPLLERDLVRDEVSGRELLRVRVRATRRERPQERVRAFAALDNEILAGVRLARIANGSPPVELSRLVGYHDDPGTPFALLEPYRGEPLGSLLRRRQLFEAEQSAFREGLLRALSWLHSCEVVHRDIRPGTVRWDTELKSVQLCGFSHATVAGTPRAAVGSEPWASHEQRLGTGTCDPRDDVWSAGLVLFQALSGHDVESGGVLPLAAFPGLAADLQDVFATNAHARPGADDLLERFSGGAVPYRLRIDAHLKPGRARFEEGRARKRAASGEPPPERGTATATVPPPRPERIQPVPPAPVPSNEPSSPSRWGGLVLLLVVLVGAAVALFAYFG